LLLWKASTCAKLLLIANTKLNRRWIRLLFGREFPFEDVLGLWDVLFAEDPALELIDFICVAMLLRVRWQRKQLLP
jgi:hypothetical protein